MLVVLFHAVLHARSKTEIKSSRRGFTLYNAWNGPVLNYADHVRSATWATRISDTHYVPTEHPYFQLYTSLST